ncbi:MAG: DUF7557 family protein [Nanoarchaeota archaeon]
MLSTTIQLSKETVDELRNLKKKKSQTYDELITMMIKMLKTLRKENQYDEFLYKVQQAKMKELWDNEEDEAWNEV